MNSIELFTKELKSTGVFACGQCRIVTKSQEAAERCCQPVNCSRCGDIVSERYWLVCSSCRSKEELEKELARMDKAEKVHSWDGPVHNGNDFWGSVEEYLEHCEDQDQTPNPYLWAAEERPLVTVDFSRVLDMITSDAWDDFDETMLEGKSVLEGALQDFVKANEGLKIWEHAYETAIVLGEVEA